MIIESAPLAADLEDAASWREGRPLPLSSQPRDTQAASINAPGNELWKSVRLDNFSISLQPLFERANFPSRIREISRQSEKKKEKEIRVIISPFSPFLSPTLLVENLIFLENFQTYLSRFLSGDYSIQFSSINRLNKI